MHAILLQKIYFGPKVTIILVRSTFLSLNARIQFPFFLYEYIVHTTTLFRLENQISILGVRYASRIHGPCILNVSPFISGARGA